MAFHQGSLPCLWKRSPGPAWKDSTWPAPLGVLLPRYADRLLPAPGTSGTGCCGSVTGAKEEDIPVFKRRRRCSSIAASEMMAHSQSNSKSHRRTSLPCIPRDQVRRTRGPLKLTRLCGDDLPARPGPIFAATRVVSLRKVPHRTYLEGNNNVCSISTGHHKASWASMLCPPDVYLHFATTVNVVISILPGSL